jgi:L-ascorbate metabolism protein UlaG (beta-lactamase superfamily)
MRLLLLILLALPAAAQTCKLDATYLANEGVMLRSGEHKVLIDALFRRAMDPYGNHAPSVLEQLETAAADFAGTDIVLATHRHADHFDPASVARHLAANPDAIFIGTAESADQVRAADLKIAARVREVAATGESVFRHAGITVRAYRLLHSGRKHWADPQSLGFIVEIAGKRVFHSGDSEGTPGNYQALCPDCPGVDAALVAYWYMMSASNRAMLSDFLKPKRLLAIHVPPGELDEAKLELRKTNPEAEFFSAPGARICLD